MREVRHVSSDVTLNDPPEDESEDGQAAEDRSDIDLEAQLELLAEENRRLREQSRRLRQNQYRRTALGLGLLGLLAGVGAALFPPVQEVLLALAGIGLFSAVLVYFVTPERFVAASIGESVYGAHARSVTDLIADLGLKDISVYVPVGAQETRLFVPQHTDYRIPAEDDLEDMFVIPDDERRRGISLHPTGSDLFGELKRTTPGELADDPTELGRQLTDALVEVFELVDSANVTQASRIDDEAGSRLPGPDDAEAEGQVTIGVTGDVYGDGTTIDHPVMSIVACGLARELSKPVVADVITASDLEVDYLVTFQWRAFVFDERTCP